MPLNEIASRHRYIAYDPELLPGLRPEVFDPEHLRREGLLLGTERSPRGAAWIFEWRGAPFLLRHYRRGGALSRLVHDRYLWRTRGHTRPAREWRLLGELRGLGLPVPLPAAWRVVRGGPLCYRADLVTALIPRCTPLHRHLSRQDVPEEEWRRLGATLRRFHDAGVWHPDLTVGNILLDGEGRFHVVDFDRARRRGGKAWKRRNLQRLRRSLEKQRGLDPKLRYRDGHFRSLLDGYRNGP